MASKSEGKKSSGRNAAKKIARREKNEAQHAANLAALRELGVQPRVRSVTKTRIDNRGRILRDKKGSVMTYTKSFEVRPSKLVRAERRLRAGVSK